MADETRSGPAQIDVDAESIAELLHELLRRTHLSAPSDLAVVVAEQAVSIGASDVAIQLIDYELEILASRAGGADGAVGGRDGRRARLQRRRASSAAPGEPARSRRLWLPLLDGTERLGVMGM